MSLLAVDVGNAHTVLGLLEDGVVGPTWRVASDERRTADEWAVLLRGLLGGVGTSVDELDGVALSSAVPAVLHEWREMLGRHAVGVPQVVVGPGVRTGLPVLTDNPREVGTDRIVGAVAALHRFGGPAVVVGLGGTATTFDVLDASGRYVGGAIAPGLEVASAALGRRGAQLREVELVRPRSAIARNTVEALQSGLVLGGAALVEGMVARVLAELDAGAGTPAAETDSRVTVVATGHLAPVVLGECTCFTDHVPYLSLEGLALVFSRNSPPAG